MGYHVTLQESHFRIKPENRIAACRHLHTTGFLLPNENMSGGTWSGGKKEVKWYAWVDMTELVSAVARDDLAAVLTAFGFTVESRDDDPLEMRLYYDSKTGDEEHLLRAIALFVEPGSTLDWSGEDGKRWRTKFDGKTIRQLPGIVVYRDQGEE